ncbi:MAG TPA: hypothetical protein VGG25_13225, partial [Streptosporangiaceae bacterium]
MPRLRRVPRKVALALAMLVIALAVPGSALAAHARPAAGHGSSTSAAPAGRSQTRVLRVQTVADTTAGTAGSASTAGTSAGGLCGVPGIGDIGGLFGFCSLGSTGLLGDLNSICSPSLPDPEAANSGIDAMVAPPETGPQPKTLYSQDGVAGNQWAATNLQCSDMTSLIGNNVAGMVFDAAKSIDRVTITVYQSAAGEGILTW